MSDLGIVPYFRLYIIQAGVAERVEGLEFVEGVAGAEKGRRG